MTDGEGTMSWGGHETWYRFVGELEPETALTPVVICHGAPARRTTTASPSQT
jgi:hypothetical protein